MKVCGYTVKYVGVNTDTYKNGCVYEHRLVAESILGRPLNESECVHHIDDDRSNNQPYNLMIFASSSDHMRFHKTGVAVRNENGTFYAPGTSRNDLSNICPVCGTPCKSFHKYCSIPCANIGRKTVGLPNRDELLALLRSKISISKIGRMFGVSSTTIRRLATSMNLQVRKKDRSILRNTMSR